MRFTDGARERVTEVRVVADYSAIFDHNGHAFDIASLGVPAELVEQLATWEERYAEGAVFRDAASTVAFDAEGLRLAQQVKRFLGPGVTVTYAGHNDTEGKAIEV